MDDLRISPRHARVDRANLTAADIFIANLVGALGQLNAGVTTMVDWCHNNPSPAHTDAAIDGLFESGIRALFLHGSPKPDPQPGQPHFSEIPHPAPRSSGWRAAPWARATG